MAEIKHSTIETNGIRMHVAEAGSGFPVVFCHGWPELWYSWRHQIQALADAGFRAIAPDMRGYGGTEAPPDPANYTMSILSADIAGLLDALGLDRVVIVGHDWGGALIWQFALRYPERTAAIIGLNTPYRAGGGFTTAALHQAFGEGGRGYYVLYFQKPGQAEAELEADVRGCLAKIMHRFDRAQDLWTFATVGGDGSGICTRIEPGGSLLTDEELDVYAAEFERTGFRGGLNWYRAIDLSSAESEKLETRTIAAPTLMITAENDMILRPELAEGMEAWIPDLRTHMIKNCAHWTQQERPAEVNALIVDFLRELKLG